MSETRNAEWPTGEWLTDISETPWVESAATLAERDGLTVDAAALSLVAHAVQPFMDDEPTFVAWLGSLHVGAAWLCEHAAEGVAELRSCERWLWAETGEPLLGPQRRKVGNWFDITIRLWRESPDWNAFPPWLRRAALGYQRQHMATDAYRVLVFVLVVKDVGKAAIGAASSAITWATSGYCEADWHAGIERERALLARLTQNYAAVKADLQARRLWPWPPPSK